MEALPREVPTRPTGGVGETKRPPRGAQKAPRGPQEDPKMLPRGPQGAAKSNAKHICRSVCLFSSCFENPLKDNMFEEHETQHLQTKCVGSRKVFSDAAFRSQLDQVVA